MSQEKKETDPAYEAVKKLTGSEDIDASELLSDPALREKLRRLKMRKMVGYGPDGIIYLAD